MATSTIMATDIPICSTAVFEQLEAAQPRLRSCRRRAPTPQPRPLKGRQGPEGSAESVSGLTDGSTTCDTTGDGTGCASLAEGILSGAEAAPEDGVFLTNQLRSCFRLGHSWQIQDLAQFKREVMQPLRKTVYILSGIDEDLTDAVITTLLKVESLIGAAAMAHEELAFFRAQVERVLVQSAQCGRGIRSGEVAAFLSWHDNLQQDLIPTYLELINQVTYLKNCVEIVQDGLHMSTDAAQQATGPLKTMGMAISELNAAASILESSSGSWLTLENVYLLLGQAAKMAAHLRLVRRCRVWMVLPDDTANQPTYSSFCKSLKDAAQGYSLDQMVDV